MNGEGKKILAVLCSLCLLMGTFYALTDTAYAKRYSLKINELSLKKITLVEGKKKNIRIKKPMMIKGVTWKIQNKKIASVKKTGKYKAVITAKKAGTTKLTAKLKVDPRVSGSYTKTAVIKVKKKKSVAATAAPSAVPSDVPSEEPSEEVSPMPSVTEPEQEL